MTSLYATWKRFTSVLSKWGLLLAVCWLCGWAATKVHIPAGWMLGPMVVALVFALSGRRRTVPKLGFVAAQGVVGIVIASTFQPTELTILADHWSAVILVSFGTLVVSIVISYLTSKLTGLNHITSTLGTLPGGAMGMVAMSESLAADTRLVALMQYLRLIFVVLTAALVTGMLAHPASANRTIQPHIHVTMIDYVVTILACVVGVWGARRLKIPAGAILGPMIVGIVCSGSGLAHLIWPPGVIQIAYAAIGIYVGMLFDIPSLKYAGRLLPVLIMSTVILIVSCGLLGSGLHFLAGASWLTSILATSPGGLDSITLMALGSDANLSFVVALQTIRLLVIVLIGPLVVRIIAAKAK